MPEPCLLLWHMQIMDPAPHTNVTEWHPNAA